MLSVMWLLLPLFFIINVNCDEANFCTKFITEQKEDVNFVIVNVGTPLVPYRLLLCTNPYVKMMNFYNIVLFSSSFGNGLVYNTQTDLDININNPNSYTKNVYTRRDYRSTISKSVTFSEIFTDEWSVVGRDYIRGIDGTWISAGIEIPNIQDGYSIFNSYCNPGGFSDTRSTDYEPKFDDIDGFFVIQPNLRLVYDQNINEGVSTFSMKDGVMSYCYTTKIFQNYLSSNSANKVISGKISTDDNLQTPKKEDVISNFVRVRFYLRKGQVVYKKELTHDTDNNEHTTIKDTHMRTTINLNTLSNNYGIETKGVKSQLSIQQNTKNNDHVTSYNTWINTADQSRFKMSTINPISMLNKINAKNKRTTESTDTVDNTLQTTVFFSLDQPYTYIGSDLYNAFVQSKNYIVDVPDDQWDNICVQLENASTPICMKGGNIVRQSFSTQKKSGSISYFPQPNIEYNSITDIASMAVTTYGTIHGGRFWGNTLVERNARSLKKTAFSKMKPNTMSVYQDDAYTKNSRSSYHKKYYPSESKNTQISKQTSTVDKSGENIVNDIYLDLWKNSFENSHIKNAFRHINRGHGKRFQEDNQDTATSNLPVRGMDLHTSYLFSNLYRLNILPHSGDVHTLYLGSTFISKNSIGYSLTINHSAQDIFIDSTNPVAFEESFLIQNTDIDNGDFIFYFIFHVVYIVMFVNILFTIKTTVNHQLLFDIFEMKKEGYLDKSSKSFRRGLISDVKGSYLFTHTKKKIYAKDIVIHIIEIVTFTLFLIIFGWSGLVVVVSGFSDTLVNLHIPSFTSTLKQVQTAFSVSSIMLVVTTLLAFVSILYICFGILNRHLLYKLAKNLTGVNRMVVFENINKAPTISDVTTKLTKTKQDVESEYTGEVGIKKETVFQFLNTQKVSIDIISYILFLFFHLIYITGCIYTISIASKTSSILRFWNIVANIVIIYICGYAILFLITILRVVPQSPPDTSTVGKSKKYKHLKQTLQLSLWLVLVVLIIIFVLVGISLIGFVIPYELDTYQADYSKYPMNFVVSTISVVCILAMAIEVWESNWKNTESLKFSLFSLRTVSQLTQIKSD